MSAAAVIDFGAIHRAIADGDEAFARRLLEEALASAPGPGDARRGWVAAALLGDAALQEGFAAAGGAGGTEEDPGAEPEDDPLDAEVETRALGADDSATIDLFLKRLGGRRDLYAEQRVERGGRVAYRPVREPFTPDAVRAHLAGTRTLGQYLLHPDGTCSFGVLDLDVSADALARLRAVRGDAARPVDDGNAADCLRRLLDAGRRLGLRLFAFDSGGRGVHAWIFLEPRKPARAVRALLATIVDAAGAAPADVSLEVFPKQETPGPKGLSSLVKLPLGVHRRTLRRCSLLDDSLAEVADTGEALRRLEPADPKAVDAVLSRRVVPLCSPELVPPENAPQAPEDAGRCRDLAEALRTIPPGHACRMAERAIAEGCALVRGLADRAFERRRLSPEEARALVFTLGAVGREPGWAEEVLAAGQASPRALAQVRKGRTSPMGCRKLRLLVPDLAGGCPCPMESQAEPYATPALHALGTRPAPRSVPLIGALPPVFDDPLLTIGTALERIEERLGRLEGARADGGETPETAAPGSSESRKPVLSEVEGSKAESR